MEQMLQYEIILFRYAKKVFIPEITNIIEWGVIFQ